MKSAYKILSCLDELESEDVSDEVKAAAAGLEKALKSHAGITRGDDDASSSTEKASDEEDNSPFGKASQKAREKFRSAKENPFSKKGNSDEDPEKK